MRFRGVAAGPKLTPQSPSTAQQRPTGWFSRISCRSARTTRLCTCRPTRARILAGQHTSCVWCATAHACLQTRSPTSGWRKKGYEFAFAMQALKIQAGQVGQQHRLLSAKNTCRLAIKPDRGPSISVDKAIKHPSPFFWACYRH